MNNTFTEVNKELGDNVSIIKSMNFHKWNNKVNTFNIHRSTFANALAADGYSVYSKGNYVEATRNGETNVFFFASHASNRSNYLIPKTLVNRVDYFAFYDEANHCVYKVSYSKVHDYTKNIKSAVRFAGSDPKLFVPDSWAKEQRVNAYSL